ncbi:MAG: 1-acyl-sn-glycerol-3-phosphate acyltransferase [Thermocrispum sp.]
MVNRHPVTGFGRNGAQPDSSVLTEESAQVIPLHSGQHDRQQEPPPVDDHGERADAEVVPLPGVAKPPVAPVVADEVDERLPAPLSRALEFVRGRLTGQFQVDDFGFDAELTESVVLPALRMLYDNWFRVSTHGEQNLPPGGGALLVCNHSGTLPIDALMTSVAVHDAHPKHRHLRMLGADLVFQVPFFGTLARKAGHTLACNDDAERLLRGGELVGVFPEGFKGVGKPFASRYKLQRFGRGGFVSAALRTGVPIIPCAIVGAEEIYPKIGDIRPLARLLGLPYFPVTPFFPLLGPLGAIPLPTKWHIEFGEAIRTDLVEGDADDPMLVFNLTDRVRESIQQMLYARLAERHSIFS